MLSPSADSSSFFAAAVHGPAAEGLTVSGALVLRTPFRVHETDPGTRAVTKVCILLALFVLHKAVQAMLHRTQKKSRIRTGQKQKARARDERSRGGPHWHA